MDMPSFNLKVLVSCLITAASTAWIDKVRNMCPGYTDRETSHKALARCDRYM